VEFIFIITYHLFKTLKHYWNLHEAYVFFEYSRHSSPELGVSASTWKQMKWDIYLFIVIDLSIPSLPLWKRITPGKWLCLSFYWFSHSHCPWQEQTLVSVKLSGLQGLFWWVYFSWLTSSSTNLLWIMMYFCLEFKFFIHFTVENPIGHII